MKRMPRGIEMQEYSHADGSVTFIGQYYNHAGQPRDRPRRVYRVELRMLDPPDKANPDWQGAVWEDDTRLVVLSGGTKWNVAWAALGALRGILSKRCRQSASNRRRLLRYAQASEKERDD